MPRPRALVPKLLHHKSSGQGRVAYAGNEYWLGTFGSPECKRRYAALLQRLRGDEQPPAPAEVREAEPGVLTVTELVERFCEHAVAYYGPGSSEFVTFGAALRPLRATFGPTAAADFGPLDLRRWRAEQVKALDWSRVYANAQTRRVRHVFRWAVSHELLAPAVHQALATVEGLRAGRTEARESAPVLPVAVADVDATLPFVTRHVRGLIEFQRLTGCRPGEACSLRLADVDRTGDVWLYRPQKHKTKHRGKARVIAIGPKARAVLDQFPTADPNEYVFSPKRAVAEVLAARAANRKTPRYPSHVQRNAAKRKAKSARTRPPADRYTTVTYRRSVDRACDLAFPAPGELARRKGESKAKWVARLTPRQKKELAEWRAAHRWSVNRLRHTFATTARKSHGLEAAQVVLGHAKADVTQVYAERDLALAVKVASELG
jgi:integrase